MSDQNDWRKSLKELYKTAGSFAAYGTNPFIKVMERMAKDAEIKAQNEAWAEFLASKKNTNETNNKT